MNDTLNKAINFAVKNPTFFDFSETLLEIKHTIKAYENATLVKDWETAYDLSISLVDLSQQLEDISQQMHHEQK